MTAAPNENWIESSLARLETLEAQREQLAAAGQTDQLTELDEEIRGLYEALESVAGDDEDEEEPANQAVAAAPVAAAPMTVAAAPMASPVSDFGAPAAMGAPMMDDDFDVKPPGSKLPLILGALLLIGGGIGAFMMFGNKTEEPKPKVTEPAKVIKAGEIVADTQEPVVAKGADGDRTRGTNFKESNRPAKSSGTRRSGGGSSSRNSGSNSKSDDGRKFEFAKGKDPLGGVD